MYIGKYSCQNIIKTTTLNHTKPLFQRWNKNRRGNYKKTSEEFFVKIVDISHRASSTGTPQIPYGLKTKQPSHFRGHIQLKSRSKLTHTHSLMCVHSYAIYISIHTHTVDTHKMINDFG